MSVASTSQESPSPSGEEDLASVQRQLEAIQDQKQAFLQDLVPLPAQSSVPLSTNEASIASVRDGPDVSLALQEAAQFDREVHFEYCALNAQATAERAALLQQYSTWQAEDAKRLTEMAAKRRSIQAAYIAEREATLIRDYEDRLAQLQQENGRLRDALAATQSGRRPALGLEVVGTYQRGQRGVEVVGVSGAALEAGAEVGDIVVGIGWQSKVDSAPVFGDAAARLRPGDLVTIDAYRHGRPITFHVIAKAPGGESQAPRHAAGARVSGRRLFCYPITDQRSSLDALDHPQPQTPTGLPPYELPDGPQGMMPPGDSWPLSSASKQRYTSSPSNNNRGTSSISSRGPTIRSTVPDLNYAAAPMAPSSSLAYSPSPSRPFAPSPFRNDPQPRWG